MPTMTSYEHGQFSWVDLMAHDTQAAKRFYSELFGWEAADQATGGGPPYTIFRLGGQDVAGMGGMPPDMIQQGVPPIWNSYITVADIEAVVAKVEGLGGKVTMPIMKVMDAGVMAFISDPTGGNVALWQKNKHIGAHRVGDPGCFCWNELATRDVDRAREFFAALLGWEFQENPHSPNPYYFIKNRGADNGGIVQMNEQWGSAPTCWMVYFTVENADQAVAKIVELGGKVIVPPFDLPVGRIAVVGDSQGAALDIIQMAPSMA